MNSILIFFIAIVFSCACVAEDCSFNRSAQIQQVKKILKAHPGGAFNEKTLSISWTEKNAPANFYAYGGCFDLGVSVRKNLPAELALDQSKVFALATKMADGFLNSTQKNTLATGIDTGEFTVSENNSQVNYYLKSNLYSEYHIQYDKVQHFVSINIVENL